MKYKKNYLTRDEYNARYKIFIENYKFIEEFKSDNETFTVELNQFADYSEEDRKSLYGLIIPSESEI